jgi:hyperosmotically inducible periplasmic protein
MYKKTAILMLSFALIISVGCSQRVRDNADLDSQIESKLDNQNLKNVDADLQQDGIVELTGTVQNENQRQLAEQTARSVGGVKQVNNLIRVDYDQTGSADGLTTPESESAKNRDRDLDNDLDNDRDDNYTENVSEKSNSNDGWLAFKTKLALYANDKVSGTDVNVESKNGVITLIGKVPNAEAKNAAVQAAKNIEGVKNVNDQLQIVPASMRKAVDDTDDNITKNVNAALDKDAFVKDIDFLVKTNNGVVTLTGEADNMKQVEKALQITRNVKGVKAVNAEPVKIENKGTNKQAKKDKGSY